MQKVDWKQLTLSVDKSIAEVMHKLNEQSVKVVFIVDAKDRLVGTITDGDIRRGILGGHTLEAPITSFMNSSPVKCVRGENEHLSHDLLKKNDIRALPVVDPKGLLLDVHTLEEYSSHQAKKNPVIIMAGGKGDRLLPLTKDTPKPLLKVGTKPILETILQNLIHYGFSNFYLSVNYKSEDIKSFFKDGNQWGVNIQYLEEKIPLGTAGCLSLLKEKADQPILVMNGDLLTKVDFRSLLSFHLEHRSTVTVCVREYFNKIPYGVMKLNGLNVSDIEEKPVQRFFVNAGIYVLDPQCISMVPKDTCYDMPTFLKKILLNNEQISSFPIHEYWIDVGQLEDFEKAQHDFKSHF